MHQIRAIERSKADAAAASAYREIEPPHVWRSQTARPSFVEEAYTKYTSTDGELFAAESDALQSVRGLCNCL